MTKPAAQQIDRDACCPACGYNLRGCPVAQTRAVVCPECGHATTTDTLYRAPKRRPATTTALLVITAIAIASLIVQTVAIQVRFGGTELTIFFALPFNQALAGVIIGSITTLVWWLTRHRTGHWSRWVCVCLLAPVAGIALFFAVLFCLP